MEFNGASNEIGQCWRDLADVIDAGVSRVLLYGPPGTGKTYAALRFGVADAVAERLVCTEDLTTGEITGTWMPASEGRWEWREGPAIRAWRENAGLGGRLVVDEVDRASGDALSTLLAMTDSPESARWRNPETSEWVSPGPGFSVVMTTNLEELDDIPIALRDRFPVAIRIDRPHPASVQMLSSDLRACASWARSPTLRAGSRCEVSTPMINSAQRSDRRAPLVWSLESRRPRVSSTHSPLAPCGDRGGLPGVGDRQRGRVRPRSVGSSSRVHQSGRGELQLD